MHSAAKAVFALQIIANVRCFSSYNRASDETLRKREQLYPQPAHFKTGLTYDYLFESDDSTLKKRYTIQKKEEEPSEEDQESPNSESRRKRPNKKKDRPNKPKDKPKDKPSGGDPAASSNAQYMVVIGLFGLFLF